MSRSHRVLVVSLAVLAVCGAAEIQAANIYWKTGAAGDWSTAANWSEDWSAGPVVNRLPVAGDTPRINNGGTVGISSNVALPGSSIFVYGSDWNITQTGGIASAKSLYLAHPETPTNGVYRMEGGELNLSYWMNLAWNNTSNAKGHFVQAGGSVSTPNLGMCIKSSTQEAYYDLEDGDFSAGNVYVGRSGANQTAVFTQSGGMAMLSSGLFLGTVAGTTGESIYNLDDGELTITGGTPFSLTQPGAPVYFDFDGGALNLPGTWDFVGLTGIANSDFRALGVAATAGDLDFTPITLFNTDYTQITNAAFGGNVIPEPSTFLIWSVGLLGLIGWRRRRR